jgi:hypothetical protein
VKRRFTLICAMAAVSFLLGNSAFASNWYVRSQTSCPTSGNGTASSCATSPGGAGAWSGFSNIPWSLIGAGDSLYLSSGDTYVGPLTIGSSGTSGNVVTITVAGGGTANINANGNIGINFNGQSYVTVDGVIGNPAFGGSTTMGIRITNMGVNNYCAYENNGGHHLKALHIECYGTQTGAADDNRGGMWLSAGGSGRGGIEAAYNYIHGPSLPAFSSSKWAATCMTVFSGTGSTSFTDNLVHDNRCDQVYHDGLRCAGNCSLYHNEVSHVDGSGHSDSLLIQSGSYAAVYNNYVHDSYDQNIYLDNLYDSACAHVRVYNNVINSSGGHGGINIDPEGGAGVGGATSGCTSGTSSRWDDVLVLNNTFYQSSSYNVYWSTRGSVTNLVVLNNIFGQVSMGGGGWYSIYLGAGTSFASGNVWNYNSYSTSSNGFPIVAHTTANYALSALQSLLPPRELNGKTGNASFASAGSGDFHLASSDTIAKGAGANLAALYPFAATDGDGKQRPLLGAWDLGAYSVSTQATTQVNPPTNLAATVQ